MDKWAQACQENWKQTRFVEDYIRENFGESPEDPVQAQSEALKAYWKLQGYRFSENSEDDNNFIVPEDLL